MTFFKPVCVAVGSDKDFTVTSGEDTGSLADTASERDSVASIISLPLAPQSVLDSPRSSHPLSHAHSPSRGSHQKRQKIFDYAQEGHSLATRVSPRLEELYPKSTVLEIYTEKSAAQ